MAEECQRCGVMRITLHESRQAADFSLRRKRVGSDLRRGAWRSSAFGREGDRPPSTRWPSSWPVRFLQNAGGRLKFRHEHLVVGRGSSVSRRVIVDEDQRRPGEAPSEITERAAESPYMR